MREVADEYLVAFGVWALVHDFKFGAPKLTDCALNPPHSWDYFMVTKGAAISVRLDFLIFACT
jgi:hypothetical protein